MERNKRVLTTHVGSLPRPAELLELLYAREEGREIDVAEFRGLADAAVSDAVRMQVEAGIDIVSDGELAKPGFYSYVLNRLSGFERYHQLWPLPDLEDLPELFERQYGGTAMEHIDTARCVGAVSYVGLEELEIELDRLRSAMERWGARDAFVPAVSPTIALTLANAHYDDAEEYQNAVVAALRTEYEAILSAGFMLQLDCPDIPMAASRAKETADIEAGIKQSVDMINLATEGLPADRMRLHLCWGNWEGPHRFDAPLAAVLPHVWAARPRAISFEAANPRHAHEWSVFETLEVPADKVIMPGVIDSKTNVVEHPELIAQRIDAFARLVGPERVIVGSDCGFGTFAGFGAVFPKVAWMKLEALGQGAAIWEQRHGRHEPGRAAG